MTWTLGHESGVARDGRRRAARVRRPGGAQRAGRGPDAGPGLAEHFEHRFRPISAGVAVPIFAFPAAGGAYRRMAAAETVAADGDGVPDAYQT